MNYRHAFHAGGFADVLKHAVLSRILFHLKSKPAAFRVIDTHAGAGLYDLGGEEATRGNEWRDGIARIFDAPFVPPAQALLEPYLEVVRSLNPDGQLRIYPGSPALALALLRPQDRLIACELEPNAAQALARHLHGDARARTIAIDGWTGLTAYILPKERRGVVVIDPAFEERDEFERMADRFIAAHRKWPTGIYLLWYPIKEPAVAARFARAVSNSGIGRILRAELRIAASSAAERLGGCGLLIANPPWRLKDELAILLPTLAEKLARTPDSAFNLDWLAGEK